MSFVRKSKEQLEKDMMSLIQSHIAEFYKDTGIVITGVNVDVANITDFQNNTTSYVNNVNCYTGDMFNS